MTDEPDMSWFDIAVSHNREVFILGYSSGWQEHGIEHFWGDTFETKPPAHLEPGAYRWTGFHVGHWDGDDAINISGGTFAPLYRHPPAASGGEVEVCSCLPFAGKQGDCKLHDRAEKIMRDFYVSRDYDPNAARHADTVKAAIAFTLSTHEGNGGQSEASK